MGTLAIIVALLSIVAIELLLDNIVKRAIFGEATVGLMSASEAVGAGVYGIVVQFPKRVYAGSAAPIYLWTIGLAARQQVAVEVATEAEVGKGNNELFFQRPGMCRSEVTLLLEDCRQLLAIVGFTTEVIQLSEIPHSLLMRSGRVWILAGLALLIGSLWL